MVYINSDESEDTMVEEELEGLCEAAKVEPVASLRQRLDAPQKATFLGSGKVDELKALVKETGAELCLFDGELSLGDVVLAGGEVAALTVIEAVSRFLPGVVGDSGSVTADSFEDGLLDYPHYTRPREWRGVAVPMSARRAFVAVRRTSPAT